MNQRTVGRIKALSIDEDTGLLNLIVEVSDNKFKKKILRDLTLSGKLSFEGDKMILNDETENKDGNL